MPDIVDYIFYVLDNYEFKTRNEGYNMLIYLHSIWIETLSLY